MKKIVFHFALLATVLFSCNDENKSVQDTIDLIAPNGERVFQSIEELQGVTNNIASEKFPNGSFVKVTSLSYFDVKEGYVARISYSLDSRYESNYLVFNIPPPGASEGRTQVECIRWTGSCQGNACCSSGYNPSTGDYSCSCSSGGTGCSIQLKCIEQM